MPDLILDSDTELPSQTSPIEVLIDCQDTAWRSFLSDHQDSFTTIVEQTIRHVRPQHKAFDVSIALVNDQIMQDLNNTYRQKDTPTNVLSFPQIEYFSDVLTMPEPIMLGDIVLSWETLTQEAQDQEKDLSHHVLHMLVHGTLHLLGYDHQNDVEAEEMESLEIAILKSFNIENPYG